MDIKDIDCPGYERVVCAKEDDFEAYVAIHSTKLGPALGGIRYWSYWDDKAAISDVLRLSKGMTYKAALAGLPLGGGKSVIINRGMDRKDVWEKFGELMNHLDGSYIAAEDVGTTLDDVMELSSHTPHVASLRSGDPSEMTAIGVVSCILTCLSVPASEATISVQGLGKVGSMVAEMMANHGSTVIVSDINEDTMNRFANNGFITVGTDEIIAMKSDVFVPCAMGGIVDVRFLDTTGSNVICGSANNQLFSDEIGDELFRRGMIYAPDFLVNAGGIINVYHELNQDYDKNSALSMVSSISQTLINVMQKSKMNMIPTHVVAMEMAEERLNG